MAVLIDFDTGEDISWFTPGDPTLEAYKKLQEARARGVYMYLFDIPGGEELLEAIDMFTEANKLLSAALCAQEATKSCLNCVFYFDERCTYFGEMLEDVYPCDEWEGRDQDR